MPGGTTDRICSLELLGGASLYGKGEKVQGVLFLDMEWKSDVTAI